ncbi:hypothetical protein MLGJGCBP_04790 [Rhodococcus sp. T7]|nr:hypothetical protein MLGJGCBP_04790 [Rhodococcus sp. T7]
MLPTTERWDSSTPLAAPVLPEVNSTSAGSSSATSGSGRSGAVSPCSSAPRSATPTPVMPAGTRSAVSSSWTITTGRTVSRAPCSSAALHQALHRSTTAPRQCAAQNAIVHSAWLRANRAT